MADFKQIDQARKLLELGEAATLKEVKQAYRRMSIRYHPDKSGVEDKAKCEEMMKRINWAYELLIAYCTHYKYPFSEQDVGRTYPYDEYFRKYYHSWFDGP